MNSETDTDECEEPLDLSKTNQKSKPIGQTPFYGKPFDCQSFAIRNILHLNSTTTSNTGTNNAEVLTRRKTVAESTIHFNALAVRPILRTRGKERSLLTCEVCSKAFDRPSLLKRHLRVHTGEKPHVCDVCGKGFSTSSSLNTHRRIHSGEKPHECPTCGKRFTASSNLYYHRMTHNKEKPHKCFTCGKSFPTPGDLKSHQYVHSGTWPFTCPICQRGFSKQTNLRNHILLHSGDKPHSCSVCSKRFALACNLRAHVKIHEEEATRSDVSATRGRCIRCQKCSTNSTTSCQGCGLGAVRRRRATTTTASASTISYTDSDCCISNRVELNEVNTKRVTAGIDRRSFVSQTSESELQSVCLEGTALTSTPFLEQLIAWNCQLANQRLVESFAAKFLNPSAPSQAHFGPTTYPPPVPFFPFSTTLPQLTNKIQRQVDNN